MRISLNIASSACRSALACLLSIWVLVLATATRAGDWPQILGPNRNGIAENEKLAAKWPASGPKAVWQRPVGSGMAGVAVADGRLVLFHRLGQEEIAECLEAQTGKLIWKAAFPTQFVCSYHEDHGPRCVPLIHRDRLFLFGAEGGLYCLNMADGKTIWKRAAAAEYQAPLGYFGVGSTPIVEGDKLLVNVGGADNGAGIVAFAVDSGKTIWKSTEELASYSSPIAVTLDGTRHLIFVTRLSALSLDPADGKVRFKLPFGARGPTVNGASPVVVDGHLFLTASYNIGAVLAKIGKTEAPIVWQNRDAMASQYPTPIVLGGMLYGIDGRQDIGVARLICIDPKTGKEKWAEEGFGIASLILADGKLLLQKTDGELVLAEASAAGFRPLAKAAIGASTTRALPALANGMYYVRDERTLKCVDLRP